MDLIGLSCNKCGAPLEVSVGTNYATCSNCKSRLAIHTSGSAAYTEVLANIDNVTSQILKHVEGVASQAGSNYELCEFGFCPGSTVGKPTGTLVFFAQVAGARGSYSAGVSEAVKWQLQGVGRGVFVPKRTPEASRAWDGLVKALEEDGWELYEEGPQWYERKFRRQSK